MKKSVFVLLAASGLAAVFTCSCGNSQNGQKQAEAGKVTVAAAPAAPAPAAEVGKTAGRKPEKMEEIGIVLMASGSRITYETKDGKKESVNAASMPSLLKEGDKIIIQRINGKVRVAKDRGMKPPIGC